MCKEIKIGKKFHEEDKIINYYQDVKKKQINILNIN